MNLVADTNFVTLDLVELTELPALAQQEAAELVYQSLPTYYDLFGFEKAALQSHICEQFQLTGSEVSDGVALYDGTVAGVSFSVPSGKIRTAQLVSFGHLRSLLPEADRSALNRKISEFGLQVQSTMIAGRYLSRFAVAHHRKGTGVADTLMDVFLQDVPQGEAATLHVKHDNERAKRFYVRHGFAAAPHADGFAYILMQRQVRSLVRPR